MVASYLGITPESLSRVRKELVKKKPKKSKLKLRSVKMKISKEKLNQIINEEIKAVLSEDPLTNLARAVIPSSGQAVNLGSAKPQAQKPQAAKTAATQAVPIDNIYRSILSKADASPKEAIAIINGLMEKPILLGLKKSLHSHTVARIFYTVFSDCSLLVKCRI